MLESKNGNFILKKLIEDPEMRKVLLDKQLKEVGIAMTKEKSSGDDEDEDA